MRKISLPIALCSCLFVSTACTKSSPKEAPSEASESETAVTSLGSGANILEAQQLTKLYPGDAIVVGAFAGPERFFTLFGRDNIATKLGPHYEQTADLLRELTGQDLLSPAGLDAFGIDPSAPIGMFFWSIEDKSAGGFVGLSDRERFLTSVRAMAERAPLTLETHEVADATILCPKDHTDVCLTVKADHAYVVGSDKNDELGLALAKRIAELDVDQSLATNDAFKAAIPQLEGGADMAGFINLSPVITTMMTELGAETTARDKAQAALVREIFGPMRTIVMGGDFDARSASAQVFIQTDAESPLTKLARNGTKVNPVIRALGEDAVMLGAYNLDPAAVFDLVKKVAAAEGQDKEDADEGLAEFEALAGFSVEGELLPALSGEFGFGFEADLNQLLASAGDNGKTSDELEAKLVAAVEGTATIGFTDAAKGKALVERVFGNVLLASFVTRDDERDLWSVPTPIGKTLLFALTAPADGSSYLVVTSSEEMLTRIKTGASAPAFDGQAKHEDYVKFIADPKVAALYSARQAMLGLSSWFMLARSDTQILEPKPKSSNTPDTPEYRKKREELAEIQAELSELRQRDGEAQATMIREVFWPWGVTAASMKVTKDGWDLRLGQFIDAPSWAELASGLVDTGIKITADIRARAARTSELWARQTKLQTELSELEMAGTGVEAPAPL
ncbi:hypothetical protein ENSA5_40140 [Enhygromyxa salina]|uniref:Uncharacterized protein n=1 Tax=Enhygromyxa salina TaxID=215803 RepID=A0A2S9XQ85_9BACT|nr:hypothetical protein [Enhygromyxa salina]PRP95016.1 hypothetical protein ENSA5_40140 [Enhygromyxa salina]